jgi:GNAT superfamily N-acetyltransferase
MDPSASSAAVTYRRLPSGEALERLGIAEELGRDFAYDPDALRSTLVGMARIAEAELTVAVADDRIVGFLFLSPPHPESRWDQAGLTGLYEVAAFEVARPWQGKGVGTGLLKEALAPAWEERILLSSLDPEEWDLLGVGLSKGSYRTMLLALFRSVGFGEYPHTLDAGLSHDAASLFLVRVGARVDRERLRRFEAVLAPTGPRSLLEINQLDPEEREAIYRRLIPEALLATFHIDPVRFTDPSGNRLVEFTCPPEQATVRIGVRGRPADPDWCYLLKLETTAYGEIQLAFVIISDPRSERFHIDRDAEGRDTSLGTVGRNIPEEVRAMRAGLAPGQIRRGLRLLRESLQSVEAFVNSLGHHLYLLEAMFYHNAILYERYGFGYAVGQEEMERIHREFQPGGELHRRLDGSTPFRPPGADRTVRGRSWAIHDGILGASWWAPRMVKRVGIEHGICTFPGSVW